MIVINLDAMLARQKMSSSELARRVGITPANLSILKTGKAKAIRFSTLAAICRELACQPGDILKFQGEYFAQQKLEGSNLTLEEMYRRFLMERGWDGKFDIQADTPPNND